MECLVTVDWRKLRDPVLACSDCDLYLPLLDIAEAAQAFLKSEKYVPDTKPERALRRALQRLEEVAE